jgi:hypothetical protein
MEKYKKKHFEDKTGLIYPNYEDVNCKNIIDEIYLFLNLKNTNNIFQTVISNLQFEDYNEQTTNDINFIISTFNFDLEEDVSIIWNDNDVDKLNIEFIKTFWNFIWYDTSDEAVILYQKKKILLITDFGRYYFFSK